MALHFNHLTCWQRTVKVDRKKSYLHHEKPLAKILFLMVQVPWLLEVTVLEDEQSNGSGEYFTTFTKYMNSSLNLLIVKRPFPFPLLQSFDGPNNGQRNS